MYNFEYLQHGAKSRLKKAFSNIKNNYKVLSIEEQETHFKIILQQEDDTERVKMFLNDFCQGHEIIKESNFVLLSKIPVINEQEI